MAVSTERLALTMPDVDNLMSQGDDILSSNYDKIDSAIGVTIVNDVDTDIPAPFQGQLAYQISTEEIFVRVSDKWAFVGSPKAARGRVAHATSTVKNTLPPGDEDRLFNISFDVEAGRRYLVHWRLVARWVQGGFGPMNLFWRFQEGDVLVGADEGTFLIGRRVDFSGTNARVHNTAGYFIMFSNVTSRVTVAWWITNLGPSGTIETVPFSGSFDQNMIVVQDWGPN